MLRTAPTLPTVVLRILWCYHLFSVAVNGILEVDTSHVHTEMSNQLTVWRAKRWALEWLSSGGGADVTAEVPVRGSYSIMSKRPRGTGVTLYKNPFF